MPCPAHSDTTDLELVGQAQFTGQEIRPIPTLDSAPKDFRHLGHERRTVRHLGHVDAA